MRQQAWVLAVAIALWTLSATPSFAAVVGAYLIALAVVHAWGAPHRTPWPRRGKYFVALVVGAVGALTMIRLGPELLERESLLGIREHLEDRWRIQSLPAFAPPVIDASRPQRFYIAAPGAQQVSWAMHGTERLEAVSLGHELFYVDYDPRAHDPPKGSTVTLSVNGIAHRRRAEVVRPTPHPRWVAMDPSRTLAAVTSEETDEVYLLDSHGFLAAWPTGDGPIGAVWLDTAHLVVAARDGLTTLSPSTGEVLSHRAIKDLCAIADQSYNGALVAGVGGREPALARFRPSDLSKRDAHPLEEPPDAIEIVGDKVVVALRRSASVALLTPWKPSRDEEMPPYPGPRSPRRSTGWKEERVELGRPAVSLGAGAPGELLVAVTGYSPRGLHLGNHFVQDQLLTVDVATAKVLSARRTAWRTERQAGAGDVDRGLSPMGVLWEPGGQLTVAFAGSDEVVTYLASAPLPSVIDLGATPLIAPHDVKRFASGTLLVTSPAAGVMGLFDRGVLKTVVRGRDAAALTAVERLRIEGEHSFYEATRSGVACQSCHLHAETDHVMRNIGGRRLAPTLTVRGIAQTAPYLRDGSYPRIGDLTHLSNELLRGWRRPALGRGEGLDAYVRSLPRRMPPPLEDSRMRAGVDAFVKARCPTCHAFPAFTHLGRIPWGFLFPTTVRAQRPTAADDVLDTPSLLSVSQRGPYMVDGRAQTLREVMEEARETANDRHGDVEALSDRELDALVGMLEAL